jgi:hypothetical protein
MTNTDKKRAEKKADTALCKLQDLFTGYNITDSIAAKLDRACDAVREVITAIENTETKRNNTQY